MMNKETEKYIQNEMKLARDLLKLDNSIYLDSLKSEVHKAISSVDREIRQRIACFSKKKKKALEDQAEKFLKEIKSISKDANQFKEQLSCAIQTANAQITVLKSLIEDIQKERYEYLDFLTESSKLTEHSEAD